MRDGEEKEEKTNVMRILDQKKIPYTARFYEDGQGRRAPGSTASTWRRPLARTRPGASRPWWPGGLQGHLRIRGAGGGKPGSEEGRQGGGEKSIELLHVAEINAVTGYIRGGCSPVGMKKQYPTVFHQTALDYETVYISAGRIGAQVELAPRALLDLLGASAADIVVDQG